MDGTGQEMIWMKEQRDKPQTTTDTLLGKPTSRKDSMVVFETDIVLPPSQRPKKISFVSNEETTLQPQTQIQAFQFHYPYDSTLMGEMTMAAQDAFHHHAEEARRNIERMIPTFLINAISTEEEDEEIIIMENKIHADTNKNNYNDCIVNNNNHKVMENTVSHKPKTVHDDTSKSTEPVVDTWRHAEIARVVVDQQQLPSFFSTDQQNSPVMALSATISTLGFDNTCMSPTGTTTKPTKSPRAPRGDDMSVSSLNDFMDCDDERSDDADHNARVQKKRQAAYKSVPAVIASKPMHKTTKKQNSSQVDGILNQTASPTQSAEKGSINVSNIITTSVQAVELLRVTPTLTENSPSSCNEIAQPSNGKSTSSSPINPTVVVSSAVPVRSLLADPSIKEIVTNIEDEKDPKKCEKEAVVSMCDQPKSTGKKNLFRFFHKLRGKQEEEKVVAQKNIAPVLVPLESVTVLSTCQVSELTVKSAPRAIIKKAFSERSLSGLMEIPPLCSDDSRLKPEMGDKYTAFADETDHVTDEARKRLDNKAPILSDVDMMLSMTPKVPSVIRNVFSADAAGDGNSFDGIARFGKVEVGDDENIHTQGTVLNRDSVAKAMNSPWNASTTPSAIPLKRTVTSYESGLASDTFIEELEVHMCIESETVLPKPERFLGIPKSSDNHVVELTFKSRDRMPTKVDAKIEPKPPRSKKRFQSVGRTKETSRARELQPIQLRRSTMQTSTCAAAVSGAREKACPKSGSKKSRFHFMKRKSSTATPTQENVAPLEHHRINL